MNEMRALEWKGSSGQRHELSARGAFQGNYEGFMRNLEFGMNSISLTAFVYQLADH